MLPKSRPMRRMLLAYTINELGTWFGYVALAVGVYDNTGSVIATAGLFIARGLLPALLAPLAVVRIERSGRRGGLAALYLAEGLLTLGLAALIWKFWLPGVLVLVAIDGAVAVAATALVRATAAHIAEEELPPEEAGSAVARDAAQRRANASLNMAFMAAFAVGPAIAGTVVHAAGGPVALVIDAASFVGCGLLLLGVRTRASPEEGSVRSRLVNAWRHVRSVPALRTLILTEAAAIVFFASVEPVEVVYAKHTLAAGDTGLGLLLGIWGAGAALGAVVFARSGRRALGSMLMAGTLLVGLGYLGFAAAPSLAAACPAAFVGGIGNGMQGPSFLSVVQRVTPAALQGRMMSAVGAISTLCPAIGFAIGGVIAAASSTRIALMVAGVVATAATGVFVRLSPERRMTAAQVPETGQPPVEALTR